MFWQAAGAYQLPAKSPSLQACRESLQSAAPKSTSAAAPSHTAAAQVPVKLTRMLYKSCRDVHKAAGTRHLLPLRPRSPPLLSPPKSLIYSSAPSLPLPRPAVPWPVQRRYTRCRRRVLRRRHVTPVQRSTSQAARRPPTALPAHVLSPLPGRRARAAETFRHAAGKLSHAARPCPTAAAPVTLTVAEPVPLRAAWRASHLRALRLASLRCREVTSGCPATLYQSCRAHYVRRYTARPQRQQRRPLTQLPRVT